MQEKNYYILLPLLPTNILQVYAFVENEKDNFENVGNNNVLLPIMHPKNVALLCYQIELKESLLSKEWIINSDSILLNPLEIPIIETYLQTFTRLKAEMYESAEAYLIAYPPIEI